MGRGPSSQPPGILTAHSPAVPSIAPINIIEERISRINSSGISVLSMFRESITAQPSENVHLHPTQLSILDAAYMSVSFGQFLSLHSPRHISEAAIIGKALFLLP